MPTPYAPGHFVWHELMTTDREGAISFYTELFGWNTKDRDMGPAGIYTMLSSEKDGFGGIMALPEGMQAPPHWAVYISVDDVDAASKQVESLGGTVVMPPFDIPETGRASVVSDPAGAHFYAFSPVESYDMPDPRAGLVGWNELMSKDVEKAKAFYTALTGWSLDSREMGDQGTYWLMKNGEKMVAGAMQMPPDMQKTPSHWLPYVGVSSIPDTVSKAEELGGHVLVPPQNMKDMGVHFGVLASPDGAAFGILEM